MAEQVVVRGLAECTRALRAVNAGTNLAVRGALREAAWPVQADATSRLSKYREIGPIGISVRARGVAVEQRARTVTGLRPDFGALQMVKGFIPALEENREETYKGVELALDVLIAREGF